MVEELHVLFGGGQVGLPLARTLLGRSKRVRIVKRSAGGLLEGVELMQGDAADLNF
jgi:Trk K+ transport system NAD-binding subunit